MKILVISQHIFPMQTPRAHRTTELVKELARKGNEVTVYAVLGNHDYSDFEKEYKVKVKNIPLQWQMVPYSSDIDSKRVFIDKVAGRLFGQLLEFPNIEFKYRIPSIFKKEERYDMLISIADPHPIHWGCSRAKKMYPDSFPEIWVADCGDPFMNNGSSKKHPQYFVKDEKEFCRLCDIITVPVSEAIEGYYPEFKNKIKVIPQGFQFELPLPSTYSPVSNKEITFAYAGTFYTDLRNPLNFLNYLASRNLPFKFVVYTKFKDTILPYQSILGDKLIVKDAIPRMELLEELKKMDFVVNLENCNAPNQIPSKLIDYSIVNRPILSVNPLNIQKEVIDEFLSANYSNAYVVQNPEQYHISRVADQFLGLVE